MSDEIKIIDRTETVIESVFKDVVTFSFLIFCIWLSQGSRWWTFFTGITTLIGLWCKVAAVVKKRTNIFKTKADLLNWANSLEWPSKD